MVVGGRPYDAHRELELIFGELTGDICICDPYIGDTTLDRLELLSAINSVRFLTQRNQANPTKFDSFKAQFTNFEFAQIAQVLHDRYILTGDSITLLGHGIKDIGKKDSFIISMDNSVAEDLLMVSKNKFDEHWRSAAKI